MCLYHFGKQEITTNGQNAYYYRRGKFQKNSVNAFTAKKKNTSDSFGNLFAETTRKVYIIVALLIYFAGKNSKIKLDD